MLFLTSQYQVHLATLSRNILSLEKARPHPSPHTYRHHVPVLWLHHSSNCVAAARNTKREYHLSSGLSRRRHDLRWVPFLVASASATGTTMSTSINGKYKSSYTLCSSSAQRGRSSHGISRYLPPPVGISAREFSSSSINTSTNPATNTTASTGDNNSNDNELPTSYSDDCPLCAKYSAGPCGTLFRQWLACTDQAAAAAAAATSKIKTSGSDEEDEHVALCAQNFDRFQACLEEHSDYYDKIHIDNEEGIDDDDSEGGNVQQAWETMIREELSCAVTESFPEALRPIVQIRPKTGQATVSFMVSSNPSKSGADNFVLAFVRNTNSKDDDDATDGNDADAYTLLAAGAKEDLFIDNDNPDARIVLLFRVPTDSSAIIVSAVYEQQDDSVAVYEYRVNNVAVD
jgi:hypothetical protein